MTILTSDSKKHMRKYAVMICFAFVLILACSLVLGQGNEVILSTATCDEVGSYSTDASDTKGQEKFLQQFSITVVKKSKVQDKIVIPETFNKAYKDYNKLQNKIGLNLLSYKGKEVKRVVYKMKNSKDYVILLVYKGHVIGGHIFSGIYGERYKPLI